MPTGTVARAAGARATKGYVRVRVVGGSGSGSDETEDGEGKDKDGLEGVHGYS